MENIVKQINIVFFGSAGISNLALLDLLREEEHFGYRIVGVVTKKDAIVGKLKGLQENIVKVTAKEYGIPVCDDRALIPNFLEERDADLCITVAFGHILKANILNIPKYGFLNIHGSLLPKLRGAIPIQMAIFQGLEKSGVTIIKMDEGMDTGDILAMKEIKIENTDNFETLGSKIASLGVEILLNSLNLYISSQDDREESKENATDILTKQDDSNASFCYIKDIDKIRYITFDMSADEIERSCRAIGPSDHPIITLQGFQIGLYEVSVNNNHDNGINAGDIQIGEWVIKKENGVRHLLVGCKSGIIELLKIKPAGRNIMNATDFWNGYLRR